MTAMKPVAGLDTHAVVNQPPPFENINMFETDRALKTAVTCAGGGTHSGALSRFGKYMGSAATVESGALANRFAPVLEAFDRYGHRIDEVQFHPAYHQLMQLGLESGFAALPWQNIAAGHVCHAALVFMLQHVDSGTTCPMTMTYAAVPALRAEPSVAEAWIPRIVAGRYDPAWRPAHEKSGVTIGMAMTEKQGGSDVRANTTRAEPALEGNFVHSRRFDFCLELSCELRC